MSDKNPYLPSRLQSSESVEDSIMHHENQRGQVRRKVVNVCAALLLLAPIVSAIAASIQGKDAIASIMRTIAIDFWIAVFLGFALYLLRVISGKGYLFCVAVAFLVIQLFNVFMFFAVARGLVTYWT